MEENVALDSSKQKKFIKSIKGIKKLIKKNEEKTKEKSKSQEKLVVPVEKPVPLENKGKGPKIKKWKMKRGLVYLSHIPHGFYEHQMTQYFKQFGLVTNVRVIKSKRTGRSKGFAFVEFKEPAVAQIVAETMNNYLMGKRLIKAAYIPPEKQRRHAMRKTWTTTNNPSSKKRMEIKKNFNADRNNTEHLKRAKHLLSNLNRTKKKLIAMGINYEFFTPVDIPESILGRMVKKEKVDKSVQSEEVKVEDVESKKPKKEDSKKGTGKTGDKTVKVNKLNKELVDKNDTSNNIQEENKVISKDSKKKKNKEKPKTNDIKEKHIKQVEVNKKEQKNKEKQLKASGVKHMQDFIEVGQDSDSDSSLEFDSDEYEKVMGSDNEFDSDDDESDVDSNEHFEIDSEDDDEDNSASADESPKIQKPTVKIAKKSLPKQKPLKAVVGKAVKHKPVIQQRKPVDMKQIKYEKQQETKRKAPQDSNQSPKKKKFEKPQNQKQQMKKQFKKRK